VWDGEGYWRYVMRYFVQCSKFTIFAFMEITLKEYAEQHNPILNRRGKPMSIGYLYRLIREDHKGNSTRSLWFKYKFEGEKDKVIIVI
jgi:hypothetical protein